MCRSPTLVFLECHKHTLIKYLQAVKLCDKKGFKGGTHTQLKTHSSGVAAEAGGRDLLDPPASEQRSTRSHSLKPKSGSADFQCLRVRLGSESASGEAYHPTVVAREVHMLRNAKLCQYANKSAVNKSLKSILAVCIRQCQRGARL